MTWWRKGRWIDRPPLPPLPFFPSFTPIIPCLLFPLLVIVWLHEARNVRLFPSRHRALTGPELSFTGLFDCSLYERSCYFHKNKPSVSSVMLYLSTHNSFSLNDQFNLHAFMYLLYKPLPPLSLHGEIWPWWGLQAGPSAYCFYSTCRQQMNKSQAKPTRIPEITMLIQLEGFTLQPLAGFMTKWAWEWEEGKGGGGLIMLGKVISSMGEIGHL